MAPSRSGKYLGILERAASEQFGLIMHTDNPSELRTKITQVYYRNRDHLPDLSFYILPSRDGGLHELFIIRKETISATP